MVNRVSIEMMMNVDKAEVGHGQFWKAMKVEQFQILEVDLCCSRLHVFRQGHFNHQSVKCV